MKKGIRKITSKTYWKKEESNGNYWEVDKRKIPQKKKKKQSFWKILFIILFESFKGMNKKLIILFESLSKRELNK